MQSNVLPSLVRHNLAPDAAEGHPGRNRYVGRNQHWPGQNLHMGTGQSFILSSWEKNFIIYIYTGECGWVSQSLSVIFDKTCMWVSLRSSVSNRLAKPAGEYRWDCQFLFFFPITLSLLHVSYVCVVEQEQIQLEKSLNWSERLLILVLCWSVFQAGWLFGYCRFCGIFALITTQTDLELTNQLFGWWIAQAVGLLMDQLTNL